MRVAAWVGLVAGAISVLGSGCASKPVEFRTLDDLMASPLRVRRPNSKAADPQAGPGGEDYRSEVPPDQKLDCQDPKELVSGFDWPSLLSCFEKAASREKPVKLIYKLSRETRPVLELEEEPLTPSCIKKTLREIPVAREVFFLNFLKVKDEDKLTCFASRVSVDSDQALGMRKLPKGRFELTITLPMEPGPRTVDEAQRQMLSWSLTPFFWEEGDGNLRAKIVPEMICGQCFGDPKVLKARDYPVPKWPN